MSADRNDLGYVRDVVRRSEHRSMPAAIAWLWATISVVGFAIVDFAPDRAGWYWLVASVVGFAVSSWIGSRHAREIGQVSRADGRRHELHWGGMLVAIFLLPALVWEGSLQGRGVGLAILLLVALGYWLAGVHLIPALKWMGGIAAAVYLVLAFVDGFPYPWTAAGIVLAAGLIVAGRASGGTGGGG